MIVCLLPGTELAFEKEVRCETGIVFSWRLGHTVAKFIYGAIVFFLLVGFALLIPASKWKKWVTGH
jgi:hypothetical protein